MARSRNTELREKILSTAFTMFYEKGVDRVLMKEIANECEISVSLLNHYFRRKEDMLVHIFYDMIHKVYIFIEHNLEIPLESQPEYAVVRCGLFYHLFYDILCRENNKLLNLYTVILYNTPLLRDATDFAFRLPSIPKFLSDAEFRFSAYVLNGSLSQIVNVYLSSPLSVDIRNLLDRLLQSYYESLGFTPQQRVELGNIINDLLTDEVRDVCYQTYMANVTNFINCEW